MSKTAMIWGAGGGIGRALVSRLRGTREDSVDGSWKPWYTERGWKGWQSSLSKHIEAFPESRAVHLVVLLDPATAM